MKGQGQSLGQRQQLHVLNQNGINGDACKLLKQKLYFLFLIIADKRIYCDIHPGSKLMGIGAKSFNVFNTITCCRPGTEMMSTNVDGICTMINGSNAILQILCGGK